MCGFVFASKQKINKEMFKKSYDNIFHRGDCIDYRLWICQQKEINRLKEMGKS